MKWMEKEMGICEHCDDFLTLWFSWWLILNWSDWLKVFKTMCRLYGMNQMSIRSGCAANELHHNWCTTWISMHLNMVVCMDSIGYYETEASVYFWPNLIWLGRPTTWKESICDHDFKTLLLRHPHNDICMEQSMPVECRANFKHDNICPTHDVTHCIKMSISMLPKRCRHLTTQWKLMFS